MRIMENGVYRDMTPEEIANLNTEEKTQIEPTLEERLAALEAAMLEILRG